MWWEFGIAPCAFIPDASICAFMSIMRASPFQGPIFPEKTLSPIFPMSCPPDFIVP